MKKATAPISRIEFIAINENLSIKILYAISGARMNNAIKENLELIEKAGKEHERLGEKMDAAVSKELAMKAEQEMFSAFNEPIFSVQMINASTEFLQPSYSAEALILDGEDMRKIANAKTFTLWVSLAFLVENELI